MTICYVGLGSNLVTPIRQIEQALAAISELTLVESQVASSLYSSKPMGPQDQPDYVNAIVEINWLGTAIELLDKLQAIEQSHGRERKADRWGPRTLDLDIILFGEEIIHSERLIVPHYGMKKREFVLYPLAEVAPNLILPCGTPLQQLLTKVAKNGLTKLA